MFFNSKKTLLFYWAYP